LPKGRQLHGDESGEPASRLTLFPRSAAFFYYPVPRSISRSYRAKAILTVREKSTARQRDNFIHEWYRKILKKETGRVLPKREERTGLKCNDWQTKYMTTRRGTCNIRKQKI
jgi:predicted metal-dependent hydrolase